ncbi:hypothetical protein [Marinoscillum furvescens]|uniref:Uncharacterized protein n=1 Tax=Marinoscillum furvescens DSM 4134 TaxID=1122208 RepID=A0A3D9L5D8_MARFU|nr:hypothetical protein [Marinoscillum furvescens]REE01129.1 hypothetical protein C7460_104149 [Marinoscillum furvescens DSM 4134]
METITSKYSEILELYPLDAHPTHLPDLVNMIIRFIRDGVRDRDITETLEFLEELREVTELMSRKNSDGLLYRKGDFEIYIDPFLSWMDQHGPADLLLAFGDVASVATDALTRSNVRDYKTVTNLIERWQVFIMSTNYDRVSGAFAQV